VSIVLAAPAIAASNSFALSNSDADERRYWSQQSIPLGSESYTQLFQIAWPPSFALLNELWYSLCSDSNGNGNQPVSAGGPAKSSSESRHCSERPEIDGGIHGNLGNAC
jgi:hypothetical protein